MGRYGWLFLPLLSGILSPSMALTCLYREDDQYMRRQYQGETVLSCDTVTVPFGDTTVFMDGTRFYWDKGLDEKNKVLIVKGTVIGMGTNAFSGSPDWGSSASSWDGILIDSCAKADFEILAIRNTTYALQVRSKDARIQAGAFTETGGILLPDSSIFRREYQKDTLLHFYSGDLLPVSSAKYKCPDPLESVSTGGTIDWADTLYWSFIGAAVVAGVWLWTLVIVEDKI